MRSSVAREVLCESLGRKVRLITRDEVEKRWFSHLKSPKGAAMELFRAMEGRREVSLQTVMLHPPIDVSTPIYTWQPDKLSSVPNFRTIAKLAAGRFCRFPVRTVIATAGDAIVPAAKRRHLRASEIQHDTLVSSYFLNLLDKDASLFDKWTLEDELPQDFRSLSHIPDAVMNESNTPTIYECIGKYRSDKVALIHEAFSHLPYVLF